ncbi:hypothetical protein E8E13_000301 [Curvularia kusanoi]|uniref:Uncharacterized protein n=1 Tax=Curvularia kusanoi TaxID=90978 RepID=A0A9P4T8B3_CURKU|nr:hypothetical protein E8E13_000301 [Curvularia kusanoi]
MPAHKRRLIREKIKYPKVTVGTVNCAGFDGGFPFEHVLSDVSSSDTEAEDDVDDTVAEGAKWVQQQEELTTRRREERGSCILKEVLAVSSKKKHRIAKDRSGNPPVPKTSRDKSKIKNSGEGTLNSTSAQKMSRASKRKARKAKRKAEITQKKAGKARRKGDGNDGRAAQIEARKDRKASLKGVERSERRTMSSRGAAGHGINITPKVSKV